MSFTPNIGSLALDPTQEYGFSTSDTVPGDNSQPTLTLNAAFPNAVDDLTIPAVAAPAVITVNSTGLYHVFMEWTWTTQASSTGIRRVFLADGDGNQFWSTKSLASNLPTTLGVQDDARLMWLPAGLELTLASRQNGGSNETLTTFVDIYRLL